MVLKKSQVTKKKIAFLLGKMSNGGAERVVSNLTIGLADKYEITTILLKRPSEIDYPLSGLVEFIDDGKTRNLFRTLFYHIREIHKILRTRKVDVVISFMEYPNILNVLVRLNVKKILSVRNFMTKKWEGKRGFIWKRSIRMLYPKADLIISPSKAIEQDIVENYNIDKAKCRVINNPYRIDYLLNTSAEPIEREYDEWFKSWTIITMGRLSRQKGHCSLIRAFAAVKKKLPEAKLVILGQGELELALKQLAQKLLVEKDVLFLGFQLNPHKYIRRSNLFVLTSLFEGFPNALVEAMVCGIPVISTDCRSGPREILAPDTDISFETKGIELAKYGIIVPIIEKEWINANEQLTTSEKLLAEAMTNVLNDKGVQNYYSKKSYERSVEYSIEKIVQKWDEIIGDVD